MALGMATTSAGGAANGPVEEPMLVDMTGLSVPIVDGDRIEGMLQVRLAVNAVTPAGIDKVNAAMPRIRATALGTIAEFARLYASPFRAVDNDRLSRALNEALRKAEPGLGDVLLIEVVARAA